MKNLQYNKFQYGSGCFKCGRCGKQTRITEINSGTRLCPKCATIAAHENTHADNSFPDDDCEEPDCPIKHYTKEQRWWIHHR